MTDPRWTPRGAEAVTTSGTLAASASRAAEAPTALPGPRDATGRKNMQQLVQLRWLAVMGQLLTVLIVHFGLDIALPLVSMLAVLGGLAVFNVASQLRLRTKGEITHGELFFALLVDVALLTVLLSLSGGTSNPFIFIYLLQVILGAVLLETWSTAIIAASTCLCVIGLALFSAPLALPLEHERGLESPYVLGLVVCFVLIAALLLVFITRINRNLRARDARLADLRQRAAEEEHIVRMGLLASGAAHELGTPLATLSVILGDWRRLPHFSSDPELLDEVCEMQAQIERCKSIVSGILMSAGEARGEESEETTVGAFLDDLVLEWQDTRPVREFDYDNRFGRDLPMVSDSTLQQMIHNVLDNALEASRQRVHMQATREDDALVITVSDDGPGFASERLAQFGKPYNSSKGRPGGGLGLFLVVNVARTLGGSVSARNLPQGGAEVRLSLPLAALLMDEDDAEADLSADPHVNERGTP